MPAMASLSSSLFSPLSPSSSLSVFFGGEISDVSTVSLTKRGTKLNVFSHPFSPLCCNSESKNSPNSPSSKKNINSFFENFFFSSRNSVDRRISQEETDTTTHSLNINPKSNSSGNLRNLSFSENPNNNLTFSQKKDSINNNNSTSISRRKRRFLLGGCSFTAISVVSGLGFPNLKNMNNINNYKGDLLNSISIGVSEAASYRDSYDDNKLLEQNRRIQTLNQAPENFPGFIREGFDVKVITGPEYQTSPSGLIFFDIISGEGQPPEDGQEVIFHYVGYNESARRVDSTYLKGAPARTRVGIGGMIPGFEEGLKGMRVGGVRRMVIPPELGPPVGPSTFFSAKQFEVFDVELLSAKNCVRRQFVFYSDVVCE